MAISYVIRSKKLKYKSASRRALFRLSASEMTVDDYVLFVSLILGDRMSGILFISLLSKGSFAHPRVAHNYAEIHLLHLHVFYI